MARGIGSRVQAAGGKLQVLHRDEHKARALAEGLGGTGGQLGTDPVGGEIVVLAVPYPAVAEIADRIGSQLTNRIVVDITNPVDFATFDSLVTPADSSAAEEIAALLPDARLVKAFNTTFAGTLAGGTIAGQPLDVFIASDDSDAARTVSAFVESSGMRPITVGPLRRARELERTGFLHMTVQQALNGQYSTGLKILN
jgi:8-hydroxy-5-deazaflavin:NADPH oxidoreductase